jgi:hypothetical protein
MEEVSFSAARSSREVKAFASSRHIPVAVSLESLPQRLEGCHGEAA